MSASEYRDELIKNAKQITRPGYGILAADESTGTIGKKFDAIGLENTETNRQRYRQLLFSTPDLEKYISIENGRLCFKHWQIGDDPCRRPWNYHASCDPSV